MLRRASVAGEFARVARLRRARNLPSKFLDFIHVLLSSRAIGACEGPRDIQETPAPTRCQTWIGASGTAGFFPRSGGCE